MLLRSGALGGFRKLRSSFTTITTAIHSNPASAISISRYLTSSSRTANSSEMTSGSGGIDTEYWRQLAFDFLRGKSSGLYVDTDLLRARETDGDSCSDLAPIPLQFEDCHYVCWLLRKRREDPRRTDEVFVVVQDTSAPPVEVDSEPKILSTTFLVRSDDDDPNNVLNDDDVTAAFVVIHQVDHAATLKQAQDKQRAKKTISGRPVDPKEYSMNKLYDLSQLLRGALPKSPCTIKPDSVSEALAKGNYLYLTFHLHYPETKVFPQQQAVFVSKEDTRQLLRGTALAYLVDYFN